MTMKAKQAQSNIRPWVLILLIAVVALAGCDVESTPAADTGSVGRTTATARPAITRTATHSSSAAIETARVVRVVDGDTLVVEIDGREDRLRYIGVDTPETVKQNSPVECFGKEASQENTRLVAGQTIELEKDVSNRDRFDRLLRYVYVVDPDTGERLFVNLELVARGYANVSTFPPDVRHEAEFRAAEREARDAGRGLWGVC
jgi:micrococcal nuclease